MVEENSGIKTGIRPFVFPNRELEFLVHDSVTWNWNLRFRWNRELESGNSNSRTAFYKAEKFPKGIWVLRKKLKLPWRGTNTQGRGNRNKKGRPRQDANPFSDVAPDSPSFLGWKGWARNGNSVAKSGSEMAEVSKICFGSTLEPKLGRRTKINADV